MLEELVESMFGMEVPAKDRCSVGRVCVCVRVCLCVRGDVVRTNALELGGGIELGLTRSARRQLQKSKLNRSGHSTSSVASEDLLWV